MWPSIEPGDTPDRIISKRLEMLLIDAFCFCSFKLVKRKVTVLNSKS